MHLKFVWLVPFIRFHSLQKGKLWTKLKKRLFGNTGIEVSEIGLGAWPFGGNHYGDVPESDGIQAIETYIDADGLHIDTARVYGESEMLIGQVLEKIDCDSILRQLLRVCLMMHIKKASQ